MHTQKEVQRGPKAIFQPKLTLNDDLASATAFAMKSSDICLEGCSLNTEFINAIFAALRLASAFVGQF